MRGTPTTAWGFTWPPAASIDLSHAGPLPPQGDTDEYRTLRRHSLRPVFYWGDVPEAVIEADEAAGVPVPADAARRTHAASVAEREAALIDVPVFLGIGERDTVADPGQEPAKYPRSPDVTLFRLPRSGHCHNFASTRTELWDRVAAWLGSTSAPARRPNRRAGSRGRGSPE